MTLTAAAPWNIMLARWGLESNLFPALFMLSVWALVKSTRNRRFVLLKNKRLAALIAISYAVCFTGFCFRYFGNDYRESVGRSFCDGIGDAINKSVELSGGETTINVVAENMPYIYALFYTQTPPEEYLNTVEYENSGVMFQKVRSFSDFRFIEHTTSFHPEVAGIYIIDASLENIARTRTDEVYNFKNYSVAVIP